MPKPEPVNPTRETSTASPEPKYSVKVTPQIKRIPYSSETYMVWGASLILGDKTVAGSTWPYEQEDYIEEWARKEMTIDKTRRGLIESYTINLEED